MKKKKVKLTSAQIRRIFSSHKAKDKENMKRLKEKGILPSTYKGHKVY